MAIQQWSRSAIAMRQIAMKSVSIRADHIKTGIQRFIFARAKRLGAGV